MGKPRRRQIVLIINRPARVWVVIHVNLCHILSHHFLAPCHKKEKHYQIKTRLKETFPLQIDIFAQFKQWKGRGGSIFQKELAEEMTSGRVGNLRRAGDAGLGREGSRKRTLGTSFHLQTLPICVTNNFSPFFSKSWHDYQRVTGLRMHKFVNDLEMFNIKPGKSYFGSYFEKLSLSK